MILQGFNMSLFVNRESSYVINKLSKTISVTISDMIFIDSNYDMDINELYHYFELFSKLCIKCCSIDPLHYFSWFDLRFDILLKVSGVKLDIISDLGVYESIENSNYFMHNKLEWNNKALMFSKKKLHWKVYWLYEQIQTVSYYVRHRLFQ